MMLQLFGILAAAVAGLTCPCHNGDGEKSRDEYVRVEVRGTLTKWEFYGFRQFSDVLIIGKGDQRQIFMLSAPADSALAKSLEKLEGQVVVVTGDLQIKEIYSGHRDMRKATVGLISVKTIGQAHILVPVDGASADQHPLVCGVGGDFPAGCELAFRHAESRELVHAVFPAGVTSPESPDGKFVLRGHFQNIQNMSRYTLKKPSQDYRYLVVSSWEHSESE
jgi:hypothetical protein